MTNPPAITLQGGVSMPQLGFGVWQVPDDGATDAVAAALRAGYRSIDTAAAYENERGTGRAVRESGLPREEVFVTTKLPNSEHGHDRALRAFDASLERLGLDYVDLYLIHWPMPGVDKYVETWKALEKIHADGRAKAIGVSNFQPAHIRRLMEETDTLPAVNQIELHPRFQQADLRAFHAEHGIATEAWSPIGQGKGLLEDRSLAAVGEKHGKTAAQVVLRWHMQLGNVAIPKSVTPSRIRENVEVFDFELDDEDLKVLGALDSEDGRIGGHPEQVNG